MASLENCTDALLLRKAQQSSHHDHVEGELRRTETHRNAALMNLKLLIGDVQRRRADTEIMADTARRSEDQLQHLKLKLSGVLLLYQKEQKKFEALSRMLMQCDAQWAGVPQQIAFTMIALRERRVLQKEASTLVTVIQTSRDLLAVTHHNAKVREYAVEEFNRQHQLLKETVARLEERNEQQRQEMLATTEAHAATRQQLVAYQESSHVMQREDLYEEAREAMTATYISVMAVYRDELLPAYLLGAKSIAAVLEEQRCSLQSNVNHRYGQWRTEELVTEECRARLALLGEQKAAYQDLVVQRHGYLLQQTTAKSAAEAEQRVAVEQLASRHTSVAHQVNALLSLIRFARSMRHRMTAEEQTRQQQRKAKEAELATVQEQHNLYLRQRWVEVVTRKYEEMRAAVEAEESLTRRPAEEDYLHSQCELVCMAAAECERVRQKRKMTAIPVPLTPVKASAAETAGPKQRRKSARTSDSTTTPAARRRRRSPLHSHQSPSPVLSPTTESRRGEDAGGHVDHERAINSAKRLTYPFTPPPSRGKVSCTAANKPPPSPTAKQHGGQAKAYRPRHEAGNSPLPRHPFGPSRARRAGPEISALTSALRQQHNVRRVGGDAPLVTSTPAAATAAASPFEAGDDLFSDVFSW